MSNEVFLYMSNEVLIEKQFCHKNTKIFTQEFLRE